MELASLFLLVLMPPADATGETAEALTAALRAELGDVTMVLAPDTLVTPAMWQGENASMRARFVAHVIWKDKNNATVDVVSNGDATGRAQFHESRSLAFAAEDSKAERGRAMALVFAELLRESPAAALIVAHAPIGGPAAARAEIALAGLFAMERVHSGAWALGPEVRVGFGIRDAFVAQASGRALFASTGPSGTYSQTEQYSGIGAGLAIAWRFLRSEHARHYLGIGLGVDVLHESTTLGATVTGGEKGPTPLSGSASTWNVAAVPRLMGCLTLWRRLRLVGSVDARLLSSSLSPQPLTDQREISDVRVTTTIPSPKSSQFRPAFALGLELAL
jgi:hypothetical protein